MRASASAGAAAIVPVGVIGDVGDTALRLRRRSAPAPESLKDLADGSGELLRGAEEGRASADHRRAGRHRAARRRGRARPRRQACAGGRRGHGRLERLCRAAHRGRPRRRPRYRLRAGRAAARTSPACSAARDVLFLLGADEIDLTEDAAAPSSSISAPMATPARTAPTSSCRAPPTPKSPAPTSTPRAACR